MDVNVADILAKVRAAPKDAVVYMGREEYIAMRGAMVNSILALQVDWRTLHQTLCGRELIEVRQVSYFRIHNP